jgi:hypothetical protein
MRHKSGADRESEIVNTELRQLSWKHNDVALLFLIWDDTIDCDG